MRSEKGTRRERLATFVRELVNCTSDERQRLGMLRFELWGAVSHYVPLIFTWFYLKDAAEEDSRIEYKLA